MICPVCAKDGKKSTVLVSGTQKTLMSWAKYYDEEGVYHSHDPNWIRTTLQCSNGHWMERRTLTPCPCSLCGYSANSEVLHVSAVDRGAPR